MSSQQMDEARGQTPGPLSVSGKVSRTTQCAWESRMASFADNGVWCAGTPGSVMRGILQLHPITQRSPPQRGAEKPRPLYWASVRQGCKCVKTDVTKKVHTQVISGSWCWPIHPKVLTRQILAMRKCKPASSMAEPALCQDRLAGNVPIVDRCQEHILSSLVHARQAVRVRGPVAVQECLQRLGCIAFSPVCLVKDVEDVGRLCYAEEADGLTVSCILGRGCGV